MQTDYSIGCNGMCGYTVHSRCDAMTRYPIISLHHGSTQEVGGNEAGLGSIRMLLKAKYQRKYGDRVSGPSSPLAY